MRFAHVNIVARDWKKLADFYQKVFKCIPLLPVRNLAGKELEKGTGIKNAQIEGIHLALPGFENGPTLEIFQYKKNAVNKTRAVNREGLAHLAFQVDDIDECRKRISGAGGGEIGELVTLEVSGAGQVSFIYVTDPEGNIIELQKWHV